MLLIITLLIIFILAISYSCLYKFIDRLHIAGSHILSREKNNVKKYRKNNVNRY